MTDTKRCIIKDSRGKEYYVTFIYGELPTSTVAKNVASLYNLDSVSNRGKNTHDEKPKG